MNKKTLLSTLLGLVLVLGLATGALATPYWGYTDDATPPAGILYDASLLTTVYSGTYSYNTGSVLATDTKSHNYVHGTFNVRLLDTWTSADTFTVALFQVGVTDALKTLTLSGTNSLGESYDRMYFDLYGAYTNGASYYMVATSSSGGTWRLTSDSFSFDSADLSNAYGTTATPVPAAVWMLGSGLLGVLGFKRSRKNAA